MTRPSSQLQNREIDPELLKKKALVTLWNALWEASQYCHFDEIEAWVEGTIREIENDAP